MMCREAIAFLLDYLSNELSAEQRREFEEHLAECPACQAYLQTYQQTIRLGKLVMAEPDALAAGQVPEDLVRAILAARQK
jgi:anti-sigma factor RsiW